MSGCAMFCASARHLFYLNCRHSFQVAAQWLGLDLFRASRGVCHADELFVMFEMSELPMKTAFSDEDKQIGNYIWQLWTNFAKTGNPTPGDVTVAGAKWER